MAETIDYRKYGLGAVPDRYDPRDYVVAEPTAAAVETYPVGFKLTSMPVKNQNTINSCVAHSIALIKEIQEFYETGKEMQFSVGWIYGYRLRNQHQGTGMMPKEALQTLQMYGDVLYDDFPENFEYNDLSKLIEARKADCLSKASKYKISTYARVTSTSSVKACLYERHSPVMIICNIYDSFYNTSANGIVPTKSGALQGSHAMTIIGWTKTLNGEYYIVQNSWGPEWGDCGVCYIKTDNNIITDMFTITDKQNEVITFKDVPNSHWAKEYIDKCVKAGLISGYTDGTFKPSNTITRAEICTMFGKMLNK